MSTPLPREEAAAQFSSAREGSVCAGVELAPQMDDVRSSRSRRARLPQCHARAGVARPARRTVASRPYQSSDARLVASQECCK